MPETEFDLIVLGAGPGGYIAAIRARQLGLRAAIVERDELGGICLNWGCIPTKALLRASEIQHLLRHLDAFGFQASDVRFDLEKLVARSRSVAKRLSAGVKHLMKKNGIPVFAGQGRLAGPGRVAVEREGAAPLELAAPHVVLATGARARTLPGLEPDGERIWTYKEAMVPKQLPGVAAGGGIGRDRRRVRELLPGPRLRGDAGRDPAADPPGRGRRDRGGRAAGVREAGHPHPDTHECDLGVEGRRAGRRGPARARTARRSPCGSTA